MTLTIVWIGVDIRMLESEYQGNPIKISLWDTAGKNLAKTYK